MSADALPNYSELTRTSNKVEIPVDQKPLDKFNVGALVCDRFDLGEIFRIEKVSEGKAEARLIGRMMSGGGFLDLKDPRKGVVNLTDPSWYILVRLLPNF